MPAKATGSEQVKNIPLSELHPFKNHPFKIKDDEAMMETADSIRQYCVLVPAIARPREGGGYELIAGHRRHRASELAEKDTIVDGLGNPIQFLLSPGNDNDCVHAVELLEKTDIRGSNILADRAYGASSIRTYITEKGAAYTIPPQSNVKNPWPVDWWLYKERHLNVLLLLFVQLADRTLNYSVVVIKNFRKPLKINGFRR